MATFTGDRVYNFGPTLGDMRYRLASINNDRSNTNLCTTSGTVALNDNWISLGPTSNFGSQDLGMITAVEAKPGQGNNPQLILVGSAMGGIFKTTDGGQNWANTSDMLNMPGLGVGELIYNPSGTIVYAGTGNGFGLNYGAGLLYSLDDGSTWEEPIRLTSNQDDPAIIKIRFDPTNPNLVYVLASFQLFLFDASTLSITEITSANIETNLWQSPFYNDMEILPGSNPTQLFLSTGVQDAQHGGAKIFRLTNPASNPVAQDITSDLVNAGSPNDVYEFFALSVTKEPGQQNKLFTMGLKWNDLKIYFEECTNATAGTLNFNANGNFNLGGTVIRCFKNEFVVSDVNSNIMYVGGLGLHKSVNRGASFSQITPIHVDIRDLQIYYSSSNSNSDELFIGEDGGISGSINGLLTQNSYNGTGLVTNLYYGVDGINGKYHFGPQDHSNTHTYEANNWSLTSSASGDGTHIVHDKIDPNKVLASSLYGSYYSRFPGTPSGILWPNSFERYWPENEPFVHSSNTYFCGLDEMFIINDVFGTPCFQRISNFKINGESFPIRSFAVAESSMGRIYVALNKLIWDQNFPLEKVIYRSNLINGQYIWEDITPYIANFDPEILRRCEISDIEINTQNENELWISFNNFDDEALAQARRVFHSTDGGMTWEDYSLGLPNYPVGKMVFQNGSGNNTLYLGNDVGVYYRNSSLAQWECYSNNLPVCVIKDLDIDYALGKLNIATMGRGAFSSDLTGAFSDLPLSIAPAVYGESPSVVQITSNETWESGRYINDLLEIMPGVVLTVKGKVTMAPNAKVIVHRGNATTKGAKLFIDGGEFQLENPGPGNNCIPSSTKWQGIEVHGYSNESQAFLGITKQGFLEMRNGAKITQAQIAVVSGSLSNPGNSGGIIRARNVTFENNINDVIFLPYTNFILSPSIPVANASYFDDCKFYTTTTEPFASNPADDPEHVVLLGVDGIRFTKCNFRNFKSITNPSSYSANYKKRGIGIYALNSTFHIGGACIPGTVPDNLPCGQATKFEQLFYGVYASNANPLKPVFIRGNQFIRNYHGILLNGINLSTVTSNSFEIHDLAPDASNPNDIPYALHLNQCSSYEVEENMFNAYNGPASAFAPLTKVALQISLPGLQPESVYNNVFQNLGNGYGVFVQGLSGDTDPTPSGLQIRCNDFRTACKLSSGNEFPTYNIYLAQNGKIYDFQGSDDSGDPTSPAGNTFQNLNQGTGPCPKSKHESCDVGGTPYEAEINTQNGLNTGITYYYHIEDVVHATEPMCYSLPNVVKSPTVLSYDSKIESCPYDYSIDPHPADTKFRINQNLSARNILKDQIDGGNASQLLGLIYGNASPGQIKNALLDASPYLSDGVLLAAINDKPSPLAPGILKQILEANSPLSSEVWQAVLNRNPALPNGILNQLNALQSGLSERKKLESQISEYNLRYTTALNDLLRLYLVADTLPNYLDSVKWALNTYDYPNKKHLEAALLSYQKEYSQALALINSELQSNPNDNLLQLQKLMIEFEQASNWCYSADTTQKEKLMDIKESGGKGCVAASAILKEILNFELPDERIVGNNHAPVYFSEEKEVFKKINNLKIIPLMTT